MPRTRRSTRSRSRSARRRRAARRARRSASVPDLGPSRGPSARGVGVLWGLVGLLVVIAGVLFLAKVAIGGRILGLTALVAMVLLLLGRIGGSAAPDARALAGGASSGRTSGRGRPGGRRGRSAPQSARGRARAPAARGRLAGVAR